MNRNIIITGSAGNLGKAVVAKFKREGFKVIAIIEPDSGHEVEDADDVYQVDVTDESSVQEFSKEYQMQYGELECMALLVGGFGMGGIMDTSSRDLEKMIRLNFFSAFNMVKYFLPIMKKANNGTFLFVGAKPALQPSEGKDVLAYALSKGLVIDLAEFVANETADIKVRSHVFVPSVIDTPQNRESMPDADFGQWVKPSEIAEAMHYAASNAALRNMTFKLYGGVY
ncbi:NAD(P)-dependent dehydrogenase, short-chain alcohol dehydrogenase family [Cyclobacterium lianum]|uniref:NAD(P)-dependent dehydrogenase, short-chain alcohol dehydrogenase family n=1 Tax=Cyclobacterium lianum TaxID=388280 RepID=A0A1M7QS87_9BACT|nr:SDR family NAD(P)-dependent oxidoreductase [Cyclobacterium lianum]SHN34615.1 NAD(P)-dependent dehydrogenase, short-chain alcohol dehydrogenase family [Cyclobacterium lianum]